MPMKKHIPKIINTVLVMLVIAAACFAFNVPGIASSLFSDWGQDAYFEGNLSYAKTRLRIALSLSPHNEQLRGEWANMMLNVGDVESAETLLEESVNALPESTLLQQMYLEQIASSGRLEDASAYLSALEGSSGSLLRMSRPEAPASYPESGSYAHPVSLRLDGETVYYQLSQNGQKASFELYQEEISLEPGSYALTAYAVSPGGLVSEAFVGEYSIRQSYGGAALLDPLMEKAVRASLNQPDGPLRKDTLLEVTSLSIIVESDPFLSEPVTSETLSLADLQYLPNLVTLEIRNFTSLSEFGAITNLVCLEDLTIYSCGITNSEIASIASLKNLRSLCLDLNNLTDASALARLSKLDSLSLSYNSLSTTEAFSAMTSLRHLTLSGNRIKDLRPLAGLKNLESLTLSQNSLGSLTPLSALSELRTLDVASNNLSTLSGLEELSFLSSLNAAGNRIYDISALTHLDALKQVSLSENNIHNILPLAGISVEVLNLSGNDITSILALCSIPTLQELNLSSNPIDQLDALDGLEELSALNINHCPITSVSILRSLPALSNLSCISCPLVDLPLLLVGRDINVTQ